MPNFRGANQFQREAPYGAVKRLQEASRSAPMSGAPVAGRALNTPARSQDAASRPARRAEDVQVPPPMPAAEDVPYETMVAQVWQEIAAQPGASELVKEIAARAKEEAGG